MEILRFPYVRVGGPALLVCLSLGCAARATPTVETRMPAPVRAPEPEAAPEPVGVYHTVLRGQTLWRIAHTYGVSLDTLIEANGIDDPTQVETGLRLWVPGAVRELDVAIVVPVDPPHEAGDWMWPVPGGRVVSHFGAPRRSHRHTGIDISGPFGHPVVAARAGRVIYSAAGMRGYGKTVIVDHGEGVHSLYAHNSSLRVRDGDWVEQGETIALVGRTGNATTDHCHFEIRVEDRPIDPLPRLAVTRRVGR